MLRTNHLVLGITEPKAIIKPKSIKEKREHISFLYNYEKTRCPKYPKQRQTKKIGKLCSAPIQRNVSIS